MCEEIIKIGPNLKKLRLSRELTLEELAKALTDCYPDKFNFNKGKLSKWENDKEEPKLSSVKLLTDFFNVTIEDLYKGKTDANLNVIYDKLEDKRQRKVLNFAEHQLEEQQQLQTFTVYGQTAAGSPIEYGQDAIEERETSYIPKGAEVALVVNGNSMEPTYPNGSIVFYKRQPQVENGSVAIVEVDGGVTCKKIKFDYENEKVILQSINPDYEDVTLDDNEVKVLGLVVK